MLAMRELVTSFQLSMKIKWFLAAKLQQEIVRSDVTDQLSLSLN